MVVIIGCRRKTCLDLADNDARLGRTQRGGIANPCLLQHFSVLGRA